MLYLFDVESEKQLPKSFGSPSTIVGLDCLVLVMIFSIAKKNFSVDRRSGTSFRFRGESAYGFRCVCFLRSKNVHSKQGKSCQVVEILAAEGNET